MIELVSCFLLGVVFGLVITERMNQAARRTIYWKGFLAACEEIATKAENVAVLFIGNKDNAKAEGARAIKSVLQRHAVSARREMGEKKTGSNIGGSAGAV